MFLKCKYQDGKDLDIDYYPHFLDADLATKWYQYLITLFPTSTRRTTLLFGNKGLVYKVEFRETTSYRPVISWEELPALFELKTLVEAVTQQKYTVCAMQYYPSGKVGINPHRDKEMVSGTRICGLSLGTPRTLSFKRAWNEDSPPIDISLASGSLYVMNPPTNQKYTHSIIKDPSIQTGRISLTFRDYA
jgi:alkylated DNA repair dioxygenase AlkB